MEGRSPRCTKLKNASRLGKNHENTMKKNRKRLTREGINGKCELRAYAVQDDTAKARAAYQDFLTLWKDADPDIPILKQAKVEYARLH